MVAAGLENVAVTPSRLAFDVDTPQDLAFLGELVAIGMCGARTTGLVETMNLGSLPPVDPVEWDALVEALGVKALA